MPIHPDLRYFYDLAGEPLALKVRNLCDEAEITIPAYPVALREIKPGQTLALGEIERLARIFPQDASLVIDPVAAAYRKQAGGLRAPFFRACANIVLKAAPHEMSSLSLAVGAAFARKDWQKTEQEAIERRARYAGTIVANIEGIIRRRMPTRGPTSLVDRERLMAGR